MFSNAISRSSKVNQCQSRSIGFIKFFVHSLSSGPYQLTKYALNFGPIWPHSDMDIQNLEIW